MGVLPAQHVFAPLAIFPGIVEGGKNLRDFGFLGESGDLSAYYGEIAVIACEPRIFCLTSRIAIR
ncbi:hypothetical protein TPY_1626 [Sulfobacillus acidophilus TPY]|nr:hypothetical protein TPY_1626 [Sulfobacillus acidophilus TPY]